MMFDVITHSTCRLVKSPSPTLARRDGIEQFESSFTETRIEHITMSKVET